MGKTVLTTWGVFTLMGLLFSGTTGVMYLVTGDERFWRVAVLVILFFLMLAFFVFAGIFVNSMESQNVVEIYFMLRDIRDALEAIAAQGG